MKEPSLREVMTNLRLGSLFMQQASGAETDSPASQLTR